MPVLVQVRKKAQVTLPQSVRTALNIEEGDFLDVKVKDGEIILRVKKLVDKDQSWFWTRRWQEGERQADEDIAAGRVQSFDTAEDATAFLHQQSRRGAGETNKE